MPYDDVQKFSEAAVNKAKLLKEQPGKYFLRSVMAGFFIVVAMIFSNVVGNVFQGSDPAWGKLLGGIVFAIAVLLIVFIGAELFTGNNLVMAFGAFDKKVSWTQVGKVWLVSYIGNFVGCLILSVIFVLAGVLYSLNYSSLVAKKFDYNTSINILVFVVLGGIGSIRGSVIAAAILTVLPEMLRGLNDYRMLIYAVVLIVMMIFTRSPKLVAWRKEVAEKITEKFPILKLNKFLKDKSKKEAA